MPKRKRDEPSSAFNSSSSEPETTTNRNHRHGATASSFASSAKQRKQLPPRLELAKKQLTKALKLARGFERQKLSRRRKTAEQADKAGDVQRVDAEVQALKTIECQKLAEAHLYKTLLKIKSVREHPALPPWVRESGGGGEEKEKKGDGEGEEGEGEKARQQQQQQQQQLAKEMLNVQARLFNSNPTKEAMAVVVKDVRTILGLDEVKGPQAKRARGEEAAKEKGKKKKKVEVEEDSSEDVEDEVSGGEGGEAEWDSEEFAGFSDRIAASSDSESEEDDVESRLKKRPYQPVRDLSFTPPSSREASPSGSSEPTFSDDEEEEESPEPEPKAKSKSKSKEKTPIVTNKSTFLPSLSAVGYISGSDSEAEDLDEQVAPQKKNRRGQRARQAIWEQKYGKGAKHVAKKNEKQKNDRNAGWDAKRGAVDGEGGRGNKGRLGRDKGGFRSGRGPQASDANLVELGKKKNHRDDGGKLHPSWEAAKLAKEKAKLGNAQFQGKKITFD